jgi:hypothetical protein
VLRVLNDKVGDRLDLRAPPGRTARAAAHVAFLFGFVQAGTPAGQRRYVASLSERLRQRDQAADSADKTPFHRSGSVR